jgi:hypothetical protein
MAFLGDFGKIFLGGATTGGVVGALTGNPALAAGAQRAADLTSRITSSQRSQQGQATAVSIPQSPPSETAMSGEVGIPASSPIYAPTFMAGASPARFGAPSTPGGMATQANLPAVVGAGRGLVSGGRGILNMLGLAGGAITVAPIIIDPLTGQEKKLRVTRKLKSDVKKAVEMFGVEFVAEQMGTDVEVVFYILTKKMRNDGPYVTKAAVRKTRQTVRKMKNLCDMYDDLRPAARRRAPMRKATTTRITNVK